MPSVSSRTKEAPDSKAEELDPKSSRAGTLYQSEFYQGNNPLEINTYFFLSRNGLTGGCRGWLIIGQAGRLET